MAQKIKKLSANLDYANQIQDKLKTTNATLTGNDKYVIAIKGRRIGRAQSTLYR